MAAARCTADRATSAPRASAPREMYRPKPIARKFLGGSRIDALFSSLHSRLPDGGTATLIPQRGLASSRTSWSPPNACRSGLLSSPSSCRMAVSAAHMTRKRLAEAGLTLLHRATHTLVAQADVRRAPRTRGAQTRRENPCQARSSRPTGAQAASRASARRAPRRPVWGGYGGDKPP